MIRTLFLIPLYALLLSPGWAQDQTAPDPLDGRVEAVESDEDGELEEEELLPEVRYDEFRTAKLRALDKITGRSTDITVIADAPVVFGSLNVELKACYQTPPELPPESAAFMIIKSTQAVRVANMTDAVSAEDVDTVSEDNPRLFSGWMFASSPGLSALEHPVYDIWVISCTTEAPSDGTSGE